MCTAYLRLGTTGVEWMTEKLEETSICVQWGAFYLLIAHLFATQIVRGTKELVVLL